MIKKLLLLAAVLGSPILGLAQGFRYANQIIDSNSRVVKGATIRVCSEPASGTPCTPLVSIYSNKTLTNALANPFTADSTGNFAFYAAAATYHVQVSATGITTLDIPDVVLGATGGNSSNLNGGYGTVAFSATPSFDTSLRSFYAMTLTGNVTSSTFANPTTGALIEIQLCQDGVGGRTFAWPASVLRPPLVALAASACTDASFFYDGTNWRLFASTGDSLVASTIYSNGAALALPTTADTLVGRGTTDIFTNKTFDTAGAGNVFKINGTAISAVTGSGSAVLATNPTITLNSASTVPAASITGAIGVAAGGTGVATFGGGTTNGVVYSTGGGTTNLAATATGGAGTQCLNSVAGAAPVWSGCSGIASTALNTLTAPNGNTAVNTGSFTTAFTGGALGGSPSTAQFSILDTTGNTNLNCLFCVNTVGTSTANPIQFTAKGTVNGILMNNAGLIQRLGTGGIADAALTSNVTLYNNGSKTWGTGANFTWTMNAGSGGTFTLVGATATNGGGISLLGANGTAGVGGAATLQSGDSTVGAGAIATLKAGTGAGDGGLARVLGGNAGATGAGGAAAISGGVGSASGQGGNTVITAGPGVGGGSIFLTPGAASGGGVDGSIIVAGATVTPAVSTATNGAYFYDKSVKCFKKSEDAAAYSCMGPPTVFVGTCSGTATASVTILLFPLGELSALTCTVTAAQPGIPMPTAGTIRNLSVRTGTAGTNGSSGVFTVLQNGVATSITCTVGTGTTCTDTNNAHTVAFAAGDRLAIQFTTQGAETLANVAATIEKQ